MLHAVVIGIERYIDPEIPSLRFAHRDAQAFAQLLERRIAPTDVSVRTLLDTQATRQRVLDAIGEGLVCEVAPGDTVLIYFAGHGCTESMPDARPGDCSRYLVAHDSSRKNIFSTGIDMDGDVARLFQRLRSRLVLMILDTCFSGRAGGRSFAGPMLSDLRGRVRGNAPVSLRNVELGKGKVILSACDDDEIARECDELGGGHGVFTHFLLKELTRASSDGLISVASLYDRVALSVAAFSDDQQHPKLHGELVGVALPRLGSRV